MSIFDKNTNKENSEEILYQAIKDELQPVLDEWSAQSSLDISMTRHTMIKETSKITMQFIWRKLGLKMPDYTRRVLDDEYNLMEFKQEEK